MKKHLTIPATFTLDEYPGQSVFQVKLHREAIADWCLGLCLLKSALIETLVVTEESGERTTEIQILNVADRAAKARADITSKVARLKLTPIHLDYVVSFFLKYYRDGVAQVDHIDLETIAIGTKSKDAYITIEVPDSVPPVTPEELRKRLG